MKGINKKLTALSVIALTASVSTVATPQPANAQIVELATSAINAIFNRPPKQIPNQTYIFGTNNFQSNSLCLFPCAPTPPQVSAPLAAPPQNIPPGAIRPGYPVQPQFSSQVAPPQVAPQPVTPPRPVLVVPPIKLPINLPL
jgi:hypothetical protein